MEYKEKQRQDFVSPLDLTEAVNKHGLTLLPLSSISFFYIKPTPRDRRDRSKRKKLSGSSGTSGLQLAKKTIGIVGNIGIAVSEKNHRDCRDRGQKKVSEKN